MRLSWVLCLLCVISSLVAEEPPPSHLMVGLGVFDFDKSKPQALAQLEYRFEVDCHHLRPLIGGFITSKTSCYFWAGLGVDIFFGKRVVLTPSFAPGVYFPSKGKNLGFPINFRSAIDLAYVLKNQGRFGIQFFHVSNAGMFFRNPGVNCIVLFYSIPFQRSRPKTGKQSNDPALRAPAQG